MSIYVDDGSDSASESIMAAVKLAVEGDGTEQNQGHLAPGINIRVLPPMVVPVNLSIIIYTYQVDIEDARVEIQTALAEYINSLTIGSSVLLSEIISALMKIAYIKDVQIIEPEINFTVNIDQIPRYGNAVLDIRDALNG
jgi:uncharacterized phage protein gp47/JayE